HSVCVLRPQSAVFPYTTLFRSEIVYHLLSVTRNHRLRVRVSTNEATPVPTMVNIWPVAGWLEREVFDMYGVLFAGNPDLRRILRSEEHTSELQSREKLVCRLLL